jgi:WD40 repeat protein
VTLWKLDGPAPRTIGPTLESVVTVAAVSPDNQLVATASSVGGKPAVVVQKLAGGEVAQKLFGLESAATSLAFTPDSTRVVAGSADKMARVWTVADGKEVAKFTGHAAPLTAVAINSDGSRAASSAADGSVKIWSLADGKEIRSIAGHRSAVVGVAFLPKDQLVTASDRAVTIFDLNTGAPVRAAALESATTSLAVSPDGARIVVATIDKTLRLITTADGATLKQLATPAPASSIRYSADGKRFVTSASNKHATVYASDDATPIESVAASFATFADKADELLVSGDDKTVRAVPLHSATTLAGITKKVSRLVYAKDGSLLFIASEDGTVRAYVTADGVAKFAAIHGSPVRDLSLSPDGAFLASAGDDKLVRLWNAAIGAPATPKPQVGPFETAPTSLAFSADSRRVIVLTKDAGAVHVFDREQGVALENDSVSQQPLVTVTALDAQKDGGDVFLAASADKSVRILRTSLRAQLSGHTGVVTSLAPIANDATRFLSGSADGTVRQWVVNGANSEKQFAFGAPIESLVARADGAYFAAAGGTFAKVFDAKTGQVTATLHGDRPALDAAQLAERESNLEVFEAAIAKQQTDAAVAQQAAETKAVATATEAKTAADKAVTEKTTAQAAKLAARDAASKTFAEAQSALATATTAQELVAKQIAVAKLAVDSANAKVAELTASSQKLAADAQALAPAAQQAKVKLDTATGEAATKAKFAADAKASADGTAAELATAEKSAADAKAAAEKDPTNKSLQDAAATAAKNATEASAKSKSAADALVTAQKAADEANAVTKTATDAYVAAQKAADDAAAGAKLSGLLLESARALSTSATASLQKANEAKSSTEQAVAAAKTKLTEAETKSKQATTEFEQTDKELNVAKFNATSAEQAIATAKTSVAKADAQVTDRKAAQSLADASVAKAKIDAENARKSAVASDVAMNCVAFAPDGITIVTGCEDGAVRTFSTEAGGIACDVIRAHNGAAVTALAVAPDGTILTGSADRTVKSTDPNPAWILKSTLGTGDDRSPFADRVLALAFSPDGTLLATGGGVPSRSGELKLWSVATGLLFRDIPDAHSDTVFGLCFNGDGKLLASGAADKFARVWNVQTGKLVRNFEGHTHHVLDVSLRYDGRALVTSGADNAVKVWDVTTGEQRAANNQFSKFEVTSVSHVGFTDRFLVTTGEGLVRLVREGDVGVDRSFDVSGANNFLYAGAATPDGTLVLSGGYDSVLRVRDARDGKVVADLAPPDQPAPAK